MTDQKPRLNQADLELLLVALGGGNSEVSFSDEDFALVAEAGLSALPEHQREQMMIRLCEQDSRSLAVLDMIRWSLADTVPELRVASPETMPAPAVESRRSPLRLALRFGWAVAACLTLVAGVNMLAPAPAAFDPSQALRQFESHSLSSDEDIRDLIDLGVQTFSEAKLAQSQAVSYQNDQSFWKRIAFGSSALLIALSVITLISGSPRQSIESTR